MSRVTHGPRAPESCWRLHHRAVGRSSDPHRSDALLSGSDVLAAERVAELRRQIDYLRSTVALLPATPKRAAALSAVRAIDRDIAELLWHLGVAEAPRPPDATGGG